MSPKRRIVLLFLSIALVGLGIAQFASVSLGAQTSAKAQLMASWAQATDLGIYRYNTTLIQTTHPTERLENVGLSSTIDRFFIKGAVDKPDERMTLKLWGTHGNVQTGAGALEIKVEQEETLGRLDGQAWQAIEHNNDLFAPNQDLLTYLVAAKNVRPGDSAQTDSLEPDYTFDLDGPTFARYMRDQMERQLRQQGKLRAGMTLDTSDVYMGMEGQGKLWLDAQGLPLRQVIELEFPPDPTNMEWVSAEIITDFSQWGGSNGIRDGGSDGLGGVLAFDGINGLFDSAQAVLTNPQALQQVGLGLAGVALLVGMLALVYQYWASRQLYIAVSSSVIISMVITPLLQSYQVASFYAQNPHRQEQTAQPTLKERQILEEALAPETIDPHTPPLRPIEPDTTQISAPTNDLNVPGPIGLTRILAQTSSITTNLGLDSDGDGLTNVQEDVVGTCYITSTNILTGTTFTCTDPTDTDRDTINDAYEVLQLGTDPKDTDTDGDQISDADEINGFKITSSDEHWYLDPLNPDSNSYQIIDGLECGAFEQGDAPKYDCDTDNDGLPNVWDDDNDGDGVPDINDSDPLHAIGSAANPVPNSTLALGLSSLEKGKPTYVDFQLRPTNPDHLWYTMNVLDWPTNDREGQIRRVFDNTLGSSSKEANGDLMLIPMLQIEIPFTSTLDHSGNLSKTQKVTITETTPITAWLDQTLLDSYNIEIRKKDNDGNLLAYVPLTLVEDSQGGHPVAFAGRMIYQPSQADFSGQLVSLVWVLHGYNDYCDTTDIGDATYDDWCAGTANWKTRTSILQTYTDEWYLTGLTVHEDHGLNTAIVWEDYNKARGQTNFNQNNYYEDGLWLLSDYLNQTFIAGRGDEATNQRDVTIEKISGLLTDGSFLSQTNLEDVYGIKTSTFATEDMITEIPMTQTKQVLEGFTPHVATLDKVTLLYLRENSFRTTSLPSDTPAHTGAITLSMDPTTVPTQVVASMNWAPFAYDSSTASWQADPLGDYLPWLEEKIVGTAEAHWATDDESIDWAGQDVQAGAGMVAQGYYISLQLGTSNVVQIDTTLTPISSTTTSDIDFGASYAKGVGAGAKFLITTLADEIAEKTIKLNQLYSRYLLEDFQSTKLLEDEAINYRIANNYLEDLGADEQGFVATRRGFFKSNTLKAGAVVATTALGVTFATVGILTATGVIQGDIASKIVSGVISSVTAVITANTIRTTATNLYKILKGKPVISNAVDELASVTTKVGKFAAVASVVLTTVIAVGFFIYDWIQGDVTIGSLTFDDSLATLAATLIAATLMAAISTIPILGELIVAVISFIDTVITTVCKLTNDFGIDDNNNPNVGQDFVKNYVCQGFTGLIKFFIYNQTPVVDLQNPHRLNPTNFDVAVQNPALGYVVNNPVHFTATIQSTLYQHPRPIGLGAVYFWQFDDQYVRQSEFRYQFVNSDDVDLDDNLATTSGNSSGTINGQAWETTSVGGKEYPYGEAKITTLFNLDAGINQSVDSFYLGEGYAINVQECIGVPTPPFGWPIIPACWLRNQNDTQHYDLSGKLKFDIMPADLDGFYALQDRGQESYALAWDSRFPVLKDADGDGLRSQYYGGNDPNDNTADLDGDGLSDFYEIQQGTNPNDPDSDDDGLTDDQEELYNTNPLKPDTDNDGLTDAEEVVHIDPTTGQRRGGWEFVYTLSPNKQSTWVSSDPLTADTDGDGITDKLEKVYGFNPRVFSKADILEVSSKISDADGIVKPGDSFEYTATITNDLLSRWTYGVFETTFPASAQSSIDPVNFTLQPNSKADLSGNVTVSSTIVTSEIVSLTNQADVLIVDPDDPIIQLDLPDSWSEGLYWQINPTIFGPHSNFTTEKISDNPEKFITFGNLTFYNQINDSQYNGTCYMEATCTTFSDPSSFTGHSSCKPDELGAFIPNTCPFGSYISSIGGLDLTFEFGSYGGFDDRQARATRLEVDNFKVPTADLTLSAWARLATIDVPPYPIMFYNPSDSRSSIKMGFNGDSHTYNFYCQFGQKEVQTVTPYTSTNWHQWGCAYNDELDQPVIYRDGQTVMTSVVSSGEYTHNNDSVEISLFIGQDDSGNLYYEGNLANLRIFTRTLSSQEMDDMFWSDTTTLDLRFEDPPGSQTFHDASPRNVAVGCITGYNEKCPVSGVPGRNNQGLAFEQKSGIVATVDSTYHSGTSDYSFAFWFKTDCEDCSEVDIQFPGRTKILLKEDQICSSVGFKTECVAFDYADKSWHHLALSTNAINDQIIMYLDKHPILTYTENRGLGDYTDEYEFKVTNNGADIFYLDEVNIFNFVLTPDQIDALYNEAPILNLHLDDPLPAVTPTNTIELYVNGQPNGTVTGYTGSLCQNDEPLYIGGHPSSSHGVSGTLVIYRRALAADEVKSIYDYQEAWFDTKTDHPIVIDADSPTATLSLDTGYLPTQDLVLAIAAVDPTSSISYTQYKVDNGVWQNATQDDSAWLFTFNPARNLSPGEHTITVRAVDVVGNVSPEHSTTVTIDNSAPSVTVGNGSGAPTLMSASVITNTTGWQVTFSGTIADSQSGLSQLHLDLHDGTNTRVAPRQTVVWTGTRQLSDTWTVTMPLVSPPNGPYELFYTAKDNVGNETGLPTSLVLTSSTVLSSSQPLSNTVWLDGTPPQAELTYTGNPTSTAAIFSHGLYPDLNLPRIEGTATDLAYPSNPILSFHFEEQAAPAYDGSRNHAVGQCQAESCPLFNQPGKIGQALNFNNVATQITITPAISIANRSFSVAFWAKPTSVSGNVDLFTQGTDSNGLKIGFNNDQLACDLGNDIFTAPAETDVWQHWLCSFNILSNTLELYRDGQLIVQETVAPYQGAGQLYLGNGFVGSIDELLVYGRPLQAEEAYNLANPTGSGVASVEASFVPRQDSLLEMYLPFITTTDTIFTDESGNGNDGVCASIETCPTLVAGKANYGQAAQFNGNDAVELGEMADLGLIQSSFTLAAWVNLANLSDEQPVMGTTTIRDSLSVGFSEGQVFFTLGSSNPAVSTNISANNWHHVAWGYNAEDQTQHIFVDGQAVLTLSGVSSFNGRNNTLYAGETNGIYLDGKLDEIRIYDYALEGEEVQALYTATSPPVPTWTPLTLNQPGQLLSTWAYLAAVNLSSPTSTLQTVYVSPYSSNLTDLVINNNYAYLANPPRSNNGYANNNQIVMLDLSQPQQPEEITRIYAGIGGGSQFVAVEVVDGDVYYLNSSSAGPGTIPISNELGLNVNEAGSTQACDAFGNCRTEQTVSLTNP